MAANAARECALQEQYAITGGINMMLLPSTTDMFQRAGMLTSDGRCKALDAAADGYVRYRTLHVIFVTLVMLNGLACSPGTAAARPWMLQQMATSGMPYRL